FLGGEIDLGLIAERLDLGRQLVAADVEGLLDLLLGGVDLVGIDRLRIPGVGRRRIFGVLRIGGFRMFAGVGPLRVFLVLVFVVGRGLGVTRWRLGRRIGLLLVGLGRRVARFSRRSRRRAALRVGGVGRLLVLRIVLRVLRQILARVLDVLGFELLERRVDPRRIEHRVPIRAADRRRDHRRVDLLLGLAIRRVQLTGREHQLVGSDAMAELAHRVRHRVGVEPRLLGAQLRDQVAVRLRQRRRRAILLDGLRVRLVLPRLEDLLGLQLRLRLGELGDLFLLLRERRGLVRRQIAARLDAELSEHRLERLVALERVELRLRLRPLHHRRRLVLLLVAVLALVLRRVLRLGVLERLEHGVDLRDARLPRLEAGADLGPERRPVDALAGVDLGELLLHFARRAELLERRAHRLLRIERERDRLEHGVDERRLRRVGQLVGLGDQVVAGLVALVVVLELVEQLERLDRVLGERVRRIVAGRLLELFALPRVARVELLGELLRIRQRIFRLEIFEHLLVVGEDLAPDLGLEVEVAPHGELLLEQRVRLAFALELEPVRERHARLLGRRHRERTDGRHGVALGLVLRRLVDALGGRALDLFLLIDLLLVLELLLLRLGGLLVLGGL